MKVNSSPGRSGLTCAACGRDQQLRKVNVLRFRSSVKWTIYRCGECGHRWVPTSEGEQRMIEEQYNEEYSGFRRDLYFAETIRQELKTRFKHYAKLPPATLLDVGCGNGEFLRLANEAGYDGQGIDVSEAATRLTRSHGVKAVAGDFLTFDFGTRFGLISMWDVAEHLRNPFIFLSRAYRLLEDKGVLILKVPHFGWFNFTVLKFLPSRSPLLLGAPDHIQYFTRNSLVELAKRAGFRSERWFPSQKFRSVPPARTLKRRLSRGLRWSIGRIAMNENFYLFLYKGS